MSGNNASKQGYAYVLSHPVWPGMVKIGQTSRDPRVRGLQIASASGLLYPPKVEWCCWVADRRAVERAVHHHLDRYRVRRQRELFRVSAMTARRVIEGSVDARTIHLPQKQRRRWRLRRRPARVVGWIMALAGAGLAIAFW